MLSKTPKLMSVHVTENVNWRSPRDLDDNNIIPHIWRWCRRWGILGIIWYNFQNNTVNWSFLLDSLFHAAAPAAHYIADTHTSITAKRVVKLAFTSFGEPRECLIIKIPISRNLASHRQRNSYDDYFETNSGDWNHVSNYYITEIFMTSVRGFFNLHI